MWKSIMSTKAKILLSKSRIIGRVQINKDMIEHYEYNDIDRYVNHDLMKSLTGKIMENFSMHIQEKSLSPDLKEKEIDLMVVPTDSFKIVVEEVIRLMPENTIRELRKS